jgi:putative methionine-R-sulfoxide reductase with GAF domain
MKIFSTKNIINLVLTSLILLLSFIIFKNIGTSSVNSYLLISINILVLIILTTNLFYKTLQIKEIEVIKEVLINDENTENEPVFEIIEDKLENKSIKIENIKTEQDISKYIENQLLTISKKFNIDQAIFYLKDENNIYNPISKYAYYSDKEPDSIEEGEGILGQAIKDKKMLLIDDIPDGYITILSGLGKGNPKTLLIVPAVVDNNIVAIAEFASLKSINDETKTLIQESISKIAKNLTNVH